MTWNFGPPQQTALFHSKDQEGRAGRPVDGRAVGNPIKGFPVCALPVVSCQNQRNKIEGGKPHTWFSPAATVPRTLYGSLFHV